ncbi:hypothetical protein J6590_083606 [Homalodisca vitripennis]|nr:hypothetical protein J6590_083603 [Homalodisca vitripennis]KAG8334748.1 hypothetical protein J6590_083606 [Homalodisca vitripennis]
MEEWMLNDLLECSVCLEHLDTSSKGHDVWYRAVQYSKLTGMKEWMLNDLLECSVCLERLDTSSKGHDVWYRAVQYSQLVIQYLVVRMLVTCVRRSK